MKRRLGIAAVVLALAAAGSRLWSGAGLSDAAARQIVLQQLITDPAFRQNPAFDPGTLRVGTLTPLDATRDERGALPPRWRAEVTLPEGALFATYWIDRTSGRVQGSVR